MLNSESFVLNMWLLLLVLWYFVGFIGLLSYWVLIPFSGIIGYLLVVLLGCLY